MSARGRCEEESRVQKRALGVLAALLFAVAACTNTGTSQAPSASSAASPTASAATSASAEPSEGATPSGESAAPSASGEGPRIGVVTDVGQLEDKSFNQFTNEGAIAAAEALGGEHDVIVTQNISDYQQNIATLADRGFNIIVTAGALLGTDTAIAAAKYPDVQFVGIDQFICLDAAGTPNFTDCSGDPAELLPNYQGVLFAEQQPGYLAGIIAASISETGTIGAIGGTNVPAVVRYWRGYENGAKSVNPDATVLYQETNTDPAKGFNDPATGRSIAQQFINSDADVLFQIAGLTGQGVLEAACDADIYGIGVDVDQTQSIPQAAGCIVTSAEKKLLEYTELIVTQAAEGTMEPGNQVYDAASDPQAIGLSPYHDFEDLITPEIQGLVDEALQAMKDGTLDACAPVACTVSGTP
jgi:basic membrane protein A